MTAAVADSPVGDRSVLNSQNNTQADSDTTSTTRAEDDSGLTAAERGVKPEDEKVAPEERSIRGFKWFCAYSSILATVFLFAIDGTIVADLQPSILESLGEIAKLPWIGVATSLGTIMILPHGKGLSLFNLKWYFIVCVIGFEAASALCGGAPTMDALIIGRALLGAFGSGVYSGGIVFVGVLTTVKERPLYFSGVIAMWGLGSVLGPVIGGAFAQSAATWRWGFYINLPIGALFAPAFLFCLPSINPSEIPFSQKLRKMDLLAIVIFCIGAVCYTMAISFGGVQYAFSSAPEIALWVLTGVFLILFLGVTYFHPFVAKEDRLYPAHLIRKLEIVNLQFQVFQCLGGVMMAIYYVPLIFQFTRGDNALEAGIRLLPLVCMMVFFAVLNGWGMPRFGYYMPWYVFGNITILAGSACMFTVTPDTPAGAIYGYTCLIGIGVGSFLTAGLSIAQTKVPMSDMTNVVGFMTIAQNIGAVTFLGIAGSVYQNIAVKSISKALPDLPEDEILQLTTGVHSHAYETLSDSQRIPVTDAVTDAITNTFGLLVAGSAIGLILSVFLSRQKAF